MSDSGSDEHFKKTPQEAADIADLISPRGMDPAKKKRLGGVQIETKEMPPFAPFKPLPKSRGTPPPPKAK